MGSIQGSQTVNKFKQKADDKQDTKYLSWKHQVDHSGFQFGKIFGS